MNFISVCKNVISSNNKNKWVNPQPAIRVSNSRSGKVTKRAHTLEIKDIDGETVAWVYSSTNGEPVIKCGAKVAIVTLYETEVVQ